MPDYSAFNAAVSKKDWSGMQRAVAALGQSAWNQWSSAMTSAGWPTPQFGTIDAHSSDPHWGVMPGVTQQLGWGTTGGTGDTGGTGGTGGTPTPAPTQLATIDPMLQAFMSKFGVTSGSNQIPFGQNISDLAGTAFNPAAATQRGIYSR